MSDPAIPVSTSTESRTLGAVKFIIYSAVGLALMFVNVDIGGTSAIIPQHIMDYIMARAGTYVPYWALLLVLGGGALPFLNGEYKRSRFDLVFTGFKVIGCGIGIMAVFKIGPTFLFEPNMIPFLFDLIVVPISLLLVVSIVSIVLVMNFGLLEFLSTFFEPLMRRVWKTPGASALDAIISFASGYAISVLVTNDLYKSGRYTAREAAIIATGFSTVSIGFMIVIANTLGLMAYWLEFVTSSIVVTFAVTAITARIYPLSRMPDTWYDRPSAAETPYPHLSVINRAFHTAIDVASKAPPLPRMLFDYYRGEAMLMTTSVMSSILSLGLIGLLLNQYTPIFDWIAYIFYPVTLALNLPEPMLTAKAVGSEISEMFIPTLLVVNSDMVTKFVTAVVSVSAVLFWSASIPCLMSTDIPIRLRDILLIWVERTILSLVLTAPIAYWLF